MIETWAHQVSDGFRAAVPLFLALALPITLFVCRSVVRSQRSATYDDLIRALYPEGGEDALPQLELVRSKYATRKTRKATIPGAAREEGRAYQNFLVIALATWLFAAFSFIGFQLLLTPKACLFAAACVQSDGSPWLQDSLAWSATLPDVPGVTREMVQTVSIAAVGFVGAYVATTQFLIRQLLNYELGAVSFLRSAFQLFLGMSVPLVAFRVGSSVDIPWVETNLDAFPTWLGLAFFLGMAPQAGISWLSTRLKLTLEKRINLTMLESAKIIPVEIIDGIDSTTKFRLDEANVSDVQNLATRNPIELYVETPYTILQVFDWVLQAQLCLVVGPDVFQRLRQHRIRTIFDLERAVLADGAPEAYVLAMGDVIFSGADPAFMARIGGEGGLKDADVIRHAVAVMCDDLHVHRLRALWKLILIRSADRENEPWLYRTGALPGDGDWTSPPTLRPVLSNGATVNPMRPSRRRKPERAAPLVTGSLGDPPAPEGVPPT